MHSATPASLTLLTPKPNTQTNQNTCSFMRQLRSRTSRQDPTRDPSSPRIARRTSGGRRVCRLDERQHLHPLLCLDSSVWR